MDAATILRAIEGGPGESGTHMHILGSTGTGKSFFLEWLLREAITSRRGFCFVDWHGTTYQRLLSFLAYLRPNREIVLLNPSEPDFIVGFNPFLDAGDDITTTVARRIDATIKPWGAANTNQTPTLERTCRILYHFAIAAGETLPNASYLLRFNHRELLDYATSILRGPEHDEVREEIEELKQFKTPQQWNDKVLSTKNRLSRFIGHTGLRAFLGMRESNIRIRELVDRNAIILVNLARSGRLETEPAKVFAALLLNEFREAAMKRAGTRKHYLLALDEFQEYITFDIAPMLDEVRKGGLHLILAHQRLGQLERDPELRDAIFTNTGVKAVFGGLTYESAAAMANEMYLDQINERWIKETYYRQEVEGYEFTDVPTETFSESWSAAESSGAFRTIGSEENAIDEEHQRVSVSEGASKSKGGSVQRGTAHFVLPKHREAVASRAEWSREEKVSQLAAKLRNQGRQECAIAIRRTPPEQFRVPDLTEYRIYPERVTTYAERVYGEIGAVDHARALELLTESQRQFFAKSARPARPQKAQPRQQRPPTGPPKI